MRSATLLILALSALSPAPRQEAATHRPVYFPSGDELLFMSDRHDGDWELFRKKVGGGPAERLTRHAGWDGYADIAPDGGHIVFDRVGAEGRGLMLLNLETGAEEWLVGPTGLQGAGGRFAPGGEEIVFFAETDGQRDLYRIRLGDRRPQRLTTTPEDEGDPAWSPDGRLLAYVRRLAGERSALMIHDPDHPGDHLVLEVDGNLYGIDWTVDGRQLVYNDDSDGDQEIYLTDLDGAERRKLTDNAHPDHLPRVSPSGTELVFTSEIDGQVERVFVMTLATGAIRPIAVD